jgi:hypothetical protein
MSADNSNQMEEGLPLVAPAVEATTESRPTQFRAKVAIATVLSLALVCLGLAANPYRNNISALTNHFTHLEAGSEFGNEPSTEASEPTFRPSDKPDEYPDPGDSGPLMCKHYFDRSEEYYQGVLDKYTGCAMFALNDVGNGDKSDGMFVCGNTEITSAELIDYGAMVDPDYDPADHKGRSVSWMAAGYSMTVTYYLEDHFNGMSETFETNGRALMKDTLGNGVVNDRIKSIKTEVKPFGDLIVPDECPTF